MKPRGWKGESQRHSMAARGVVTRTGTWILHNDEPCEFIGTTRDVNTGNLEYLVKEEGIHKQIPIDEQIEPVQFVNLPKINYESLDAIVKSLYGGLGWERGKKVTPYKVYLHTDDWKKIAEAAKKHGAGLSFFMNRMPSSDVTGDLGIQRGEVMLKPEWVS